MLSPAASKPELLYISPVVPDVTGNGLAMRAGTVLEALSELYRISLLVVPYHPANAKQVPDQLASLCERLAIIEFERDFRQRVVKAGEAFHCHAFDTVHVFRLSMLAFARPYLDAANRSPHFHLDLDDIESKTHDRIAQLHANAGDLTKAKFEKAWSRTSFLLEAAALHLFERVYVCSEPDKEELVQRGAADIQVLNNAVRLQAGVGLPCLRPGEVFTFLFVGTLAYYPNQDAVEYFCGMILPILRQRATRPFRVHIVGADPPESLRRFASPDVWIIGTVDDVRPWYEECHAVIVPIRAGGGSRIKILEAFSYYRPVVTTKIGIEGIGAESKRHALIEDSPEGFAEACLWLMSDSERARQLVENAGRLLTSAYTMEALKKRLAALH